MSLSIAARLQVLLPFWCNSLAYENFSFHFQHACKYCKVLFPSATARKKHQWACVFCDNCDKYVELRHLKSCKGKKEVKGTVVLCGVCRRFRSKKNMPRHMLSEHSVSGWQARDHPDLISKVSNFD